MRGIRHRNLQVMIIAPGLNASHQTYSLYSLSACPEQFCPIRFTPNLYPFLRVTFTSPPAPKKSQPPEDHRAHRRSHWNASSQSPQASARKSGPLSSAQWTPSAIWPRAPRDSAYGHSPKRTLLAMRALLTPAPLRQAALNHVLWIWPGRYQPGAP